MAKLWNQRPGSCTRESQASSCAADARPVSPLARAWVAVTRRNSAIGEPPSEERHVDLGVDIMEPALLEERREMPGEVPADPAGGQPVDEDRLDDLGVQPGVQRRDREAVGFFDQEPASGAQRGHQAIEDALPVGQVHDQSPAVHEVEARPGKVGDRDVGFDDVEVVRVDLPEEAAVDVDRRNPPLRAGLPAEVAATDPPPAPTSRQRQPDATPSARRRRMVAGS